MHIQQGLPTDVFASANMAHMQALVDEEQIQRPVVFAGNTLAVVYNEAYAPILNTVADIGAVKRLVLGVENVPIGIYTTQMLEKIATEVGAGFQEKVRARVVSYEKNVRLVRAKVELGEADAAIVYSTEAQRSTGLSHLSIPDEFQVPIHHSMGVIRGAKNAEGAQLWMDFVRSEIGQASLREHGFKVFP